MRNVLVGAVEGTEVALRAMATAGHPPVLVVTLPPEKAARHSDYRDLHPLARALGIETLDAAQVNDPAVVARLEAVRTDHLLVLGWSQLVGPAVMRTARKGAIGLHPAPLPELRGRAAIPWTILSRRTRTATSLFWIDEGMDSGDLLAQRAFDVAPDETARSLYDQHLRALEAMFAEVLPSLAAGNAARVPQDHARASWCAKRTPADGLIEWTRPADDVWTLVRAVGRPYPGAFTYRGDGTKLWVWSADLVEEAPYLGIPGQVVAFEERLPSPGPSTSPLRGYAQDERKVPFTARDERKDPVAAPGAGALSPDPLSPRFTGGEGRGEGGAWRQGPGPLAAPGPSALGADPLSPRFTGEEGWGEGGAWRQGPGPDPQGSALIACSKGFLRVKTVSLEGHEESAPRAVLKLHERLGIPLDALFADLLAAALRAKGAR